MIHNYTWLLKESLRDGVENNVSLTQSKTDHEHDCEKPSVESISAYMDGKDLILIIDGVESRLPGGGIGASLDEDGEVEVFVRASFVASVADLSNAEPGS